MVSEKLIIKKSVLNGKVKLSGAKNCGLKLLTASILTSEKIKISNSPNELLDMKIHIEMLEKLGKSICIQKDLITIEENNSLTSELIWTKRSIRNSLLMLGCLTTRFGKGRVPLPGGCKLGDRKYDLHLMILKKMGAKVWEEDGYICTQVPDDRLKGTNIKLAIRSTGATENAILMASLAKGQSVIWNPHIRPEIIDLIKMLNKMGANIDVYGQKCIVVNGVKSLNGVSHKCIPDNMEALTWAIAASITGGNIEIEDFPFEHLEIPLIHLRESGMKFYKGKDSLIVTKSEIYPIDICTGPYPSINSDMQPLFAVFGAIAQGNSKIIDLRFPGRYNYVNELNKLGVEFSKNGDSLEIIGGKKLKGNHVTALNLRAGVALVLAGLCSEGVTIIDNTWQIFRGYEFLVEKVQKLGGEIEFLK